MHAGHVAGGDRGGGGAGRQDGDPAVSRRGPAGPVSSRRPRSKTLPPEEERLRAVRQDDEDSVRERAELCDVRPRSSVRTQPVPVELPVDRADENVRAEPAVAIRPEPSRLEAAKVRVSAFPARAMAGRQRGRLVQEEQLRVPIGGHDRPVPTAKREDTGDPGAITACDPSHHPPAGLVEAPTVPHEHAARRRGDQLAERGDAVLERPALERLLDYAAPSRRSWRARAAGAPAASHHRRLPTVAPSSASSWGSDRRCPPSFTSVRATSRAWMVSASRLEISQGTSTSRVPWSNRTGRGSARGPRRTRWRRPSSTSRQVNGMGSP